MKLLPQRAQIAKEDCDDCNSRKLPLRRRAIRNHRATIEPIKLPLLFVPIAFSLNLRKNRMAVLS
jgi:hypothetical protein